MKLVVSSTEHTEDHTEPARWNVSDYYQIMGQDFYLTSVESGGKLSWAQLLRCKTRYFTDGVVIGSKGFVDNFLGHLKSEMGEAGRFLKHSSGARKMRRVEGQELHTMRDLKKNVIAS